MYANLIGDFFFEEALINYRKESFLFHRANIEAWVIHYEYLYSSMPCLPPISTVLYDRDFPNSQKITFSDQLRPILIYFINILFLNFQSSI